MSDHPKWAPLENLTPAQSNALEAVVLAVQALRERKAFKDQAKHYDAFRRLEKACGFIAHARDVLCPKVRTMFGFCQALRPLANQHAPELAMTLMAWELRLWPGQTPDDKPVATPISTPV